MISACTPTPERCLNRQRFNALEGTSAGANAHCRTRQACPCWPGNSRLGTMKLYRVNKLTKPGGAVIKKKHNLATSDKQAVKDALDSDDCPVCDVLRDGIKVGEIHS